MKNYLVGAIRPVSKVWGYWKPSRATEVNVLEANVYGEMYEISRRSARKHLQGEWEEVLFTAPVRDARMYQISQWYTIKELWHKEECNILAMGCDTLFLKPTEIFGKYNKMMMFNYTDPKKHQEFPHYMNDDIRYYPADMDPDVWAVGEEKMQGWFEHTEGNWGWGQLLHNYQFWSQDITIQEALQPHMAYQGPDLYIDQWEARKQHSNIWNGCELKDANILHLHGSRNSEGKLALMKRLEELI